MTAFLGELVGAPVADDSGAAGAASAALHAARQDAQLMSELMRRAWLDFLHAETAAHPVVIVLDDLHWGDFGTVRFIDAALRERSTRRASTASRPSRVSTIASTVSGSAWSLPSAAARISSSR